MTDAGGQLLWWRDQTPFGQTVAEGGFSASPLRFPGQYADAESGLAYNYFRDYDPALGRYIQSDPIGLGGGLNTYGYVGGNPLRYADPLGLSPALPIAFCNAFPQFCYGPDTGGGGGAPSDPNSCESGDQCDLIRDYEEGECYSKYSGHGYKTWIFQGCMSRAAERWARCKRSGGTMPPDAPRPWSDADVDGWPSIHDR